MPEMKKARTGAPTPERAMEETCSGPLPENKYTTLDRSISISEFLRSGADNALHLGELMLLTGADGRTVRKAIEVERRRGVPILSDNRNGYFLPACEEEKERFARSMRRRAGEIMQTVQAVERGGRKEAY
ncbi:MAG: hypothetical protein LUE16_04625 [Lachnospiraceae bacterium]|nr:hypothetical protein [Lachnospiraceae bacterium]